MKVYISADMEGATGVVAWKHVSPKESDYGRMRKLLTGDVNAAIRGAFRAGASEVLVNDAHGPMVNILLEELDSRARLISGHNKHLCQMEGINDSFDACFLVAYHGREGGADAVLNHTLLGRTVWEIRLNGKPVGETAISAALAGYYGVPVVLVTGDQLVSEEAASLIPGVRTVVVKEALDRYVACCLAPERTATMIEEAAAEALTNRHQVQPFVVEGMVEFEVDFKTTAQAHAAALLPMVRQVSPKTVALQGRDYLEAFRLLFGALLLGRSVTE